LASGLFASFLCTRSTHPWARTAVDLVAAAGVSALAIARLCHLKNSRENEAEAVQAKLLMKGEARRSAVNVARLPELLGKGDRD
jgi:hypothetical protein